MMLRVLLLIFSIFSLPSRAAEGSSSYTFEIYPYFGVDLPNDIKGLQTTVKGGGVRGTYVINAPASLELGSFFWKSGDDSGRTFDGGIYYEIQSDIKAYFSAGLHYSTYAITVKYKTDGACVNQGCQTASGTHQGFYVGGGINVPISNTFPLKTGLRFYKGPNLWVLVDVGVGFRF
jgi:hypothetical protein